MSRRKLNKKGIAVVSIAVVLILALLSFLVFKFVLPLFSGNNSTKGDNLGSSDFSMSGDVSDDPQDVSDVGSTNSDTNVTTQNNDNSSDATVVSTDSRVKVRGVFNTFGGYTSAIVANGGLTTQEGSYYDKAGLDVTLGIEDEDDVIVQSFIDGDIDFFFMTVNKMPIVCKRFIDNGIDVVIPYFSDTSTGGDGIVVRNEFDSVLSLQNARIAMARNSVSTAIPLWFFNNNDLDPSTVQTIASNFQMYDSTQEAVDAFIAGEADAVSTWDMTTALSAENSHLLFSTAEGENLVIDALIVNKAFADAHPNAVTSLIDGCISAVNDVASGNKVSESYDAIRASVPDFADYDDETMASVLADSKWLGYERNVEVFSIASGIYTDFSAIWDQLGEETAPEYVTNLFDQKYLNALSSKWSNDSSEISSSVNANDIDIAEREALIRNIALITFEPDSAEFKRDELEKNYELMDNFIKNAKILNGMVISLEGNVSLDHGQKSSQFSYTLSQMRADAVKDYMVANGIEASRIITKGNGGDKPYYEFVDASDENFAKNRNVVMSIYSGLNE